MTGFDPTPLYSLSSDVLYQWSLTVSDPFVQTSPVNVSPDGGGVHHAQRDRGRGKDGDGRQDQGRDSMDFLDFLHF